MQSMLTASILTKLFNIIMINIVLSGDNVAVIGLAMRNLPVNQRKGVALAGSAGAVILRVIFSAVATLLIRIPWVNTVGGLILLLITWKLIMPAGRETEIKAADAFWKAVQVIIVADISMSFDNVMGVAAAAQGSIGLLLFGLIVSIPILILGGTWIAALMDRHPIIIYLGAAVLAHTSISMIIEGLNLVGYIGAVWAGVIPWLFAIPVLGWGCLTIHRQRAQKDVAVETGK